MTNFHCYLMMGLIAFFIFWLLLLLRDFWTSITFEQEQIWVTLSPIKSVLTAFVTNLIVDYLTKYCDEKPIQGSTCPPIISRIQIQQRLCQKTELNRNTCSMRQRQTRTQQKKSWHNKIDIIYNNVPPSTHSEYVTQDIYSSYDSSKWLY